MRFRWKGRIIFFATGNINKFNEARKVLAEFDLAVALIKVKALEIQSNSLEEIAIASVTDAFSKCNLPIIVEDAGLFVDVLNGFPGPYAAYVYKTIGNAGLLRLLRDEKNRKARFRSVIAYKSAEVETPKLFGGESHGIIVSEERRGDRRSGFGFDPVFKPDESGKTFAEMSIEEKNLYSHRARALRSFAKWYRGF
ncbi:XTP/dITP diphosphatase [Candidatus Bathyarchaeota archaeon]|nr:XTP/dITP diphosphatase [Candidatus Bathyarchaeota archaeon]